MKLRHHAHTVVVAAVAALAAFIIGCDDKSVDGADDSQDDAASSAGEQPISKETDPLLDSALFSANEEFALLFAEHEGSYFTKWDPEHSDSKEGLFAEGRTVSHLVLTEYRGVTFELVAQELSDADRLNGIAWRGAFYCRASATREFEDGVWTKWHSNHRASRDHRRQVGLEWPLFVILDIVFEEGDGDFPQLRRSDPREGRGYSVPPIQDILIALRG